MSTSKNVGQQAQYFVASRRQNRNAKAQLTAERHKIYSELTREEWLPVDELPEGW